MNALRELLSNVVVALGASRRNIKFEDRRFRIARREDLMRSVAVRTDGGFLRARGHGLPMDALFVGNKHLRALPAGRHDELLSVTSATGSRNVGVIHARLRIAFRQPLVRACVTVA